MIASKIDKIISIITSFLFTAFLGICASCIAHVGHTWDNNDAFVYRIGEYLDYLIIPGALLLVALAVKIVFLIIRKIRKTDFDEKTARELLEGYLAGHRVGWLDVKEAKTLKKILRFRNVVDFLTSQILVFAFVFVLDYLVFFANFTRENRIFELNSTILRVLPICLGALLVFTVGRIFSDSCNREAVRVLKKEKVKRKNASPIIQACSSPEFKKIKKQRMVMRIIKSVMSALGAGAFVFGACNIVHKLALIKIDPWISIIIGSAAALVTCACVFFALRVSDKKLAEDLDRRFGLKEKIQTMVEYNGGDGTVLELQRQDAEKTLSEVKFKGYKLRGLWICTVVLVLGAALTVTSVLMRNRWNDVPEEVVIPFELSAMKERGLEELIEYVETSKMESEYRVTVADTLKQLLADLKVTRTEPEMQMHLAEAMTVILKATKDSSSSTEILNALWNTEDSALRKLARALDTSAWGSDNSENWGDYADRLNTFKDDIKNCGIEKSDEDIEKFVSAKPKLTNYLEMRSSKARYALSSSGISDSDAIYSAVSKLVGNGEYEHDGKEIYGFSKIAEMGASIEEEQLLSMVDAAFSGISNELFDATNQKKTNTNVGEYALTKLSTLFLVPLPEFERPDFVKNGDTDGGNSDAGGKDDDAEGGTSGGVGMGSIYGSNDLVLDPFTGEYVEYGTLLDKYFAIMEAKLADGDYTELQKEAIRKYFALLYGGMDKEEGN